MSVIDITDNAVKNLKEIIASNGEGVIGVRLSVGTKGCSGNSYQLDLVKEPNSKDDLIEKDGVKIYVDPLSFMYIFGSTMDWEESDLHNGFKFVNPNEKGRCGCGESFHI